MQNIDPTMVDVWKAITTLHVQDDYSWLDQKSRAIIFAVADAEMQQRPINYRGVIALLRPKSQMPMYSRLRRLTREGWIKAQADPNDRRAKILYLTPKSVSFVNSLSLAIRRVVKATAAMAAALVAEMTYHDISPTLLFASSFTSI